MYDDDMVYVGRGVVAPRPAEVVGTPAPERFSREPRYGRRADADADSRVVTRPGERDELAGALAIPGISLPSGFRLGAWIDVGGHHLGRHMADHVSAMHAMGLNDACVMVNRLPSRTGTFRFDSVSESVLNRLAPLLRSGGIDLTLTAWLRPEKTYIDSMLATLPDVARRLRARAIEFDVEEPWTRTATPSGFSDHRAAADYVWDAMDSLRGMGIEVGATTQVDVMTSGRLAPVVRRAHFVVPQAYSSRGRAIGSPYGPQGLQRRAVDRLRAARRVSGTVPMIMGLAAYGRHHWSPRTSRQIMILELQETLRLRAAAGIQGARYWSWKWIAGLNARGSGPAAGTPYARRFMDDLR